MTLAEIIFERIPAAMLERVVYDQGLLDQARFTALFKASGLLPNQIAEKIVEAYGDRAAKLAFGLYQQINDTDWETARDLYEHFNKTAEFQYDNHQASFVGRYPTLSTDGLSEFLRSVKRQVCLIVSRKGNNGRVARGTGFLIGPDLVLTSRHLLRDFTPDDDIGANGSRIEIYFDFFHGNPVDDFPTNPTDAIKLGLNNPWHVASCDGVYHNGKVVELPEEKKAELSKSLDFILLRLETRVGLQPVDKGGGRRRGWVQLPKAAKTTLPSDEWIIIPQHPNGFSQRIDIGRFYQMDDTGTRLRYNTNTAKGTSGAPCFDHEFSLVGVHNAQVGPGEKPWANEAIWFEKIAATVRLHVEEAAKNDPYALRWSIARANEAPQVILGREKLLNWLRDSATASPRNLADRVYVAQADLPGAGCSFSINLLQAEIRDSKTRRAVYGARGQQLPATPEDFLLALLRELDIKLDANEAIPPRPSANAQADATAGEVDKLERWLSDELPNWLGGVIVKYVEKQNDIRPAAKQALEYYLESNQEPPEEIKRNADAKKPIFVRSNLWDFAYVVIDDLRGGNYRGNGARTELKGEVRSLIAALVKGKTEQAMHPGLRRLRWMFLGFLPDFVSANTTDTNGVTLEVLDPAAIKQDEVLSVFTRMSDAYVPMRETPPKVLQGFVDGLITLAESRVTADTRLSGLQETVSIMAASIIKRVG